MTSTAYQGGGNVVIEFQAGADLDKALDDVRNKVAQARPDLPDGADEPTVNEVNLSEFPVLVITLSGDVPERVLAAAGRELRDRIEELPAVLDAEPAGRARRSGRGGHRPRQAGDLRPAPRHADRRLRRQQPAGRRRRAGRREGRYAIKVPSLIETAEDVANLPVIVDRHGHGAGARHRRRSCRR